jgi:hypothetical protein
MYQLMLNLWQDESKFRAFFRGCLAMAGALAPLIPGVPLWVAPIVIAASQFISAGQQNTEGRKEPSRRSTD